MPNNRQKLGDFGEQVASAHLHRLGLALVARKWRGPGGEIDLVMRDGPTVVFVEVRTRRSSAGDAVESIGRAKRRRLAELAYSYLEQTLVPAGTPWRIDVVAIAVDAHGRVTQLAHLRDAIEES